MLGRTALNAAAIFKPRGGEKGWCKMVAEGRRESSPFLGWCSQNNLLFPYSTFVYVCVLTWLSFCLFPVLTWIH